MHFKELFALDGKHANLTQNDVQRRNRIAQLLADWGLISIVDVEKNSRHCTTESNQGFGIQG